MLYAISQASNLLHGVICSCSEIIDTRYHFAILYYIQKRIIVLYKNNIFMQEELPMLISVLIENTAQSPGFICEHGLSLFIQTKNNNILFDTGASNSFITNSQTLGIDLTRVNTVILSHGHHDHSGGLKYFFRINPQAFIYMQENVRMKQYARHSDGTISDVGIDSSILSNPQIVFIKGNYYINNDLFLFSEITTHDLSPSANDILLIRDGDRYRKDPFLHEQSLLITENGKKILIAGCAHSGIINILEKAVEHANGPLDAVISGFHLFNPENGNVESDCFLEDIATRLKAYPSTKYFTCHCTGQQAYKKLSHMMGSQIQYISAGTILDI